MGRRRLPGEADFCAGFLITDFSMELTLLEVVVLGAYVHVTSALPCGGR